MKQATPPGIQGSRKRSEREASSPLTPLFSKMGAREAMKKSTIFLTIILTAALLYGCEATTRYRVLSFFFDGVPDPEEERVAKVQKGDAGEAGVKKRTSYQHGPYAAKMCNGCHIQGTNRFVASIEELCVRCHEFRMDKQWIHGPLASGGCRVCHDPHSSRQRYLLVSKSEEFCLHCHDEKAIARNEAHKDVDTDCTSCHNAHMSDRRYLLK
ncbi:MAG: hypothetical protein HZA16_03400 [Nitrospirae bacterium]|nr:hypothetical protein [Nitrospirota bacterium]